MKSYSYQKTKQTRTRFEWLQLLTPYNVEAINAVRFVYKDKASEYLDVVRSGHNPVNVFMESILFKDTKEGVDYWINTCKEIEKLKKYRDLTKKHIVT